jgi:hypothetical protein
MIGDFVFHEKYGNAIIETIDNDFGDNPSVKLISENIKHKDGYKYGYCWCDLDEMFPIPLTPEILEKNGFTRCGQVYANLQQCVGKFGDKRKSLFQDIRTGEWGMNDVWIDYVHELQHVLKLCGIEKSIEL